MRNNRDERYSGFSGWLRKNRTALRSCGIAAAVIGTGLAVWYGVGMYQQRKAEEAMIAARYETQQEKLEETLAEMAKEDQESADSGTQTGKEMLFEENTVFWNGKTYKRNTYVKAVLCMGVDRDGPMTETDPFRRRRTGRRNFSFSQRHCPGQHENSFDSPGFYDRNYENRYLLDRDKRRKAGRGSGSFEPFLCLWRWAGKKL